MNPIGSCQPASVKRFGIASAAAFALAKTARQLRRRTMSIDKQSDIAANLQIGPTSLGMVRIYLEADGIELPLDFEPEEAEEIADELRAAAEAARAVAEPKAKPKKPAK
jgi:hypothetical protein